MKNNLFVLLTFILMFTGFVTTILFIYPQDITLSKPLYGSYVLLVISIIFFILNYFISKKDFILLSVKQYWIVIILNYLFWYIGLTFALICLYALPLDDHIEPLASSLFLLSGMIVLSGNFFMKKA